MGDYNAETKGVKMIVLQIVGSVLFSVFSAGGIIFGLSSWLGKVWANRILEQDKANYNREIEEIKNKFTRELEYYKSQVELYKLSLLRFSEHQFNLYNKLWLSLSELKIAGDNLWERVDENSVLEFVYKVAKAQEDLLKNALLIEESHEKELSELLEKFANYSVGKHKLIELDRQRQQNSVNWWTNFQDRYSIVQDNDATKKAYDKLLLSIKSSFRKQLKEGMPLNIQTQE